MISENELQQIARIMHEELKPINERLDKIEDRLGKVEERLDKVEDRLGKVEERLDKVEDRLGKVEERFDELEYNMEIVKGATNALTEWAEAASKYYTPQIHFPLEKDEKIS